MSDNRALRGCDIDGCTNRHRATGLCSTHWNQQHATERHRKVEVPCSHCGRAVVKERRNESRRPFCDYTCRDLDALERSGGDPCRAARAALPPPRGPKPPPTSCALPWGSCDECDRPIIRRGRRRYCRPCAVKVAERRRRLRKSRIRRDQRLRIFERDGWRCWLCGFHIDPALAVPHPDAATVDHLTPVSHGGTDEDDNLGAAHQRCNSARGNRQPAAA